MLSAPPPCPNAIPGHTHSICLGGEKRGGIYTVSVGVLASTLQVKTRLQSPGVGGWRVFPDMMGSIRKKRAKRGKWQTWGLASQDSLFQDRVHRCSKCGPLAIRIKTTFSDWKSCTFCASLCPLSWNNSYIFIKHPTAS